MTVQLTGILDFTWGTPAGPIIEISDGNVAKGRFVEDVYTMVLSLMGLYNFDLSEGLFIIRILAKELATGDIGVVREERILVDEDTPAVITMEQLLSEHTTNQQSYSTGVNNRRDGIHINISSPAKNVANYGSS